MKKSVGILLLVAAMVAPMFGCTQQQRAKSFGGNMDLFLPKGEKLVNITWKMDHLWYLTKKMSPNDMPETYEFVESSNFGVLNGKITVHEER